MAALPRVIQGLVRDYRARLEGEFPGRVRRVAVFGSVARGEATEDSDLDVLVLLERATFAERRRAVDIGAELAMSADMVMAPLVLTVPEWTDLERRERLLPAEVARDGIEVVA